MPRITEVPAFEDMEEFLKRNLQKPLHVYDPTDIGILGIYADILKNKRVARVSGLNWEVYNDTYADVLGELAARYEEENQGAVIDLTIHVKP